MLLLCLYSDLETEPFTREDSAHFLSPFNKPTAVYTRMHACIHTYAYMIYTYINTRTQYRENHKYIQKETSMTFDIFSIL